MSEPTVVRLRPGSLDLAFMDDGTHTVVQSASLWVGWAVPLGKPVMGQRRRHKGRIQFYKPWCATPRRDT